MIEKFGALEEIRRLARHPKVEEVEWDFISKLRRYAVVEPNFRRVRGFYI